MKYAKRYSAIILAVISSVLLSCEDDQFNPATITFYPGVSAAAQEPEEGEDGLPVTITLKTSRILNVESQVNIFIQGNGAGYGASYVTNPPQLEPGITTLTIQPGESDASFTFIPQYDGIFEPLGYEYQFKVLGASNAIKSVGNGVFTMKVADNTSPFLEYDFNDCVTVPVGPTEVVVPGDGIMQTSTWGCTSFGFPNETTSAAEANAFGKGVPGVSNSYLIIPAFSGNDYNQVYVSMEVYSRFTGAGSIQVLYSNNYSGSGNPEAEGVTWTPVDQMNSQIPAAGSRVWKNVGALLDNLSGQEVYFAIQFKGGSTTSSSSWRIDNFSLKGN
ncbi:MAG: choice-of-anchor J domain-containing protein [Cyclobacteriaceae bacterium]